SMQGLELNTF
nr:immunoglobulin light chain junction region [Macaca mulatta]